MQLQQLRYMLAIAEEENITKAANKMFVSQSAMSQQLLKTEKEIGMPLFDRDGKNLKITKAGEIYMNSARAILTVEKAFYREAEMLKENYTALNIAVSMAISEDVLEIMIQRICRRFEGFDMNFLDAGTAEPDQLDKLLIEGMADIVIGPGTEEGHTAILVLEQETSRLVYVRPDEQFCDGAERVLLANATTYLRQKENEAFRHAGFFVEVAGVTELNPEVIIRTGILGGFLNEEEALKYSDERRTEVSYDYICSARILRFGRVAELFQKKV